MLRSRLQLAKLKCDAEKVHLLIQFYLRETIASEFSDRIENAAAAPEADTKSVADYE